MSMFTLFAIFTLGANQQEAVIIPNLTRESCEAAAANMRSTGRVWDVKPMCLQQVVQTNLSLEKP